MSMNTSTPSTTKAWTYTNPGFPSSNLSIKNAPVPPPSPSTILVRVRAAALNPVDIQLMNFPLWTLPILSSRPKGLGFDFAGTVIHAGPTSGFTAGDEVMGLNFVIGSSIGTVAEVLSVDAAAAAVVKKPESWSEAKGAAIPLVWLTARTCVDRVEAWVEKGGKKGTVAVLGGSSATGMYVVWIAKKRGWRVIATCSAKNIEFVKIMGADDVMDYTTTSVPDALKKVKPDAIIDCVGGTECLGIAGRYITIVGDKTSRAKMGGNMTYLWNPWMVGRMLWGWLGWGEAYECVNLEPRKDWLQEAKEVPADQVIVDSTFTFEKTKDALERLNSGRCVGKVVVEIGQ